MCLFSCGICTGYGTAVIVAKVMCYNLMLRVKVTNDEFVVVPAEKASHTTNFVCKSHYIIVYGITNSLGNPTYTPTILKNDQILEKHQLDLCFFGISNNLNEELDIHSLYLIT